MENKKKIRIQPRTSSVGNKKRLGKRDSKKDDGQIKKFDSIQEELEYNWQKFYRHMKTGEKKKIKTKFELFSAYIRTRKTLNLAKNLTGSLLSLPLDEEDTLKLQEKAKKLDKKDIVPLNARVFLAAFMITEFPHSVLATDEKSEKGEFKDEIDKLCCQAAKNFTAICLDPSQGKTEKNDEKSNKNKEIKFKDLSTKERELYFKEQMLALRAFHNAFLEWKEFDKMRLLKTLQAAYFQWNGTKTFIMQEQQRHIDKLNAKQKAENKETFNNEAPKSDEKEETPDQDDENKGKEEEPSKKKKPRLKKNDKHKMTTKESLEKMHKGNQMWLDEITRQQELVKKKMIMLGGEELVAKMLDPETQKVIHLDKVLDEAKQELYWKNFEKEIASNNFANVIKLLFEIRNRIKKLVPRSQQEKELAKIDGEIDVEFFMQMMKKGNMDYSMFVSMVENIWSRIKYLQSPQMDKEWLQFKDHIYAKIKSGEGWEKLLPFILNRFLVQLDRVEEHARLIKDAIKKHLKAKKEQEEQEKEAMKSDGI